METEKIKLKLVLRTRKIVDITKELGGKNFENVFFKMINDKDLEKLTRIIYTLAENDEGKKVFNSSMEVYDFIDDYKKEKEKTYDDIFEEIAEVINEEGFFNKKMTKQELETRMSDMTNAIDMETILKNTTEKVATEIATEEFRGYKA